MPIAIIYAPCPDAETAQRLIDQLLAEKLIACGNHFPATSSFFWENAVQTGPEQIAILKTLPEKSARAAARIEAVHPYETPCVLTFLAEANPAFETWARSLD